MQCDKDSHWKIPIGDDQTIWSNILYVCHYVIIILGATLNILTLG
jgi:G:T/U-mismatch repair DNA glycosylase